MVRKRSRRQSWGRTWSKRGGHISNPQRYYGLCNAIFHQKHNIVDKSARQMRNRPALSNSDNKWNVYSGWTRLPAQPLWIVFLGTPLWIIYLVGHSPKFTSEPKVVPISPLRNRCLSMCSHGRENVRWRVYVVSGAAVLNGFVSE